MGNIARDDRRQMSTPNKEAVNFLCFRETFIFLLICFSASASEVDFNRDVRPIISENCLACHGFDKESRKADLRLDTLAGATSDLGGYAAIVPGKPDESELIRRIASTDEGEIMPPADSHKKPLKPEDIALLTKWVEQGAKWGKHWSFEPPRRGDIPEGIHPVDHFVQQKLADEKLKLAPTAAVHTLARRLAFDITGLPPTPERVKQLSTDLEKSNRPENVWREYIDELLASKHYGERMAMWWLDGARYSDTDGFQQDATRTNWPWRDWVIDSFNANKPFDEFTIEQFAGDLLPEATDQQRLATCFHRNHMNNGEGGRDPEESRVDYVLDRVNTTGTLWLGLTLGCTQCHDHKFDPISQADYYSLSAFFNSIDETGAAGSGAKPQMKVRSPYAQRHLQATQKLQATATAELAAITAAAKKPFETWLADNFKATRKAYRPWETLEVVNVTSVEGTKLSANGEVIIAADSGNVQDDYVVTALQPKFLLTPRISAVRLTVFPDESNTAGKYSFADTGEFVLTNFKLRVRKKGKSLYDEVPLRGVVADVSGVGKDSKYGKVAGALDDDPRTGWTTRTKPADKPHIAIFELAEPITLAENEVLDIVLMQRSLAPKELISRFKLEATDQRGAAVRSLGEMPMETLAKTTELKNVPAPIRERLFQQYLQDNAAWQEATENLNTINRQLAAAKKAAGDISVAVLAERKDPRNTNILIRGVWNKKGDEVSPALLPVVYSGDNKKPMTRLELGRWVVSRNNPLTARVIVNQIWQQFFGAGLVRTPADFGLQGEPPTHPELLDYLAVEFMESGWNVKQLVRTIVTSKTYRQRSDVNESLLKRDPENRLLARGPRYRLPSWMIRDALLKSSGLLNEGIGGPPIFPWQPPGVWKDQFMGRFEYQPTLGPEQYRRTIYAFWRRSSAPTFLFDSAMRRVCEVNVRRTNTPLHALTLMNDRTSLQASYQLAKLAEKTFPNRAEEQITAVYWRVLSREPTEAELKICKSKLQEALAFFESEASAPKEFLSTGGSTTKPTPELAALMLIANMIINLDEAITHE